MGEFYLRYAIGVGMMISIEYQSLMSLAAIFSDLWLSIAVITGICSFLSFTILVFFCD